MSYNLTIERKDDALLVKVTGKRSVEAVLAMSKDILKACAETGVKRVLVDVRHLEGQLKMMEAYDVVDQHFPKMRDRSIITHAAIVDSREPKGGRSFFETIAVNRGFALRVFTDADKALEWLMS
jgi:hypothetical protein